MRHRTQPRHERSSAPRGRTYESIDDATGGTPLVRLRRVVPDDHATVLAKCEFCNPLGTVKDRVARAMIDAATRQSLIDPGTHIVEATSGDMGVALAYVCAAHGHRLTITMPQSSCPHRQAMLRAMGVAVVLTPDAEGMPGAMSRACELVASEGNAWMPRQFDNPVNAEVHEQTTGPEIWTDAEGRVDMVVTGVGTGGTITGVTRYLRSVNAEVKAYAVEPASCAVISGGKAAPHRIAGLGAGFVPQILDTDLLDGVETVTDDEACHWTRRLATEEGLFVGISGGASVCAAARVAEKPENAGKTIVTILPCSGERNL